MSTSIDLSSYIIDIPNYPKPGVVFKDLTPLFANPEPFQHLINLIKDAYADEGITHVIGAEARGFMLGAPLALAMGCGFVPARKPHKLPRETFSQTYELEYGTDELQIHVDALPEGARVLVVDDLIATGGTAVASAQLAERAGATVVGFAFILELGFLSPRTQLEAFPEAKITSLLIAE